MSDLGGLLPGGPDLGGVCFQGGLPWVEGGLPQTPLPVNRITDTCKNITLATTSLRPVTSGQVADKFVNLMVDVCLRFNCAHFLWPQICGLTVFLCVL